MTQTPLADDDIARLQDLLDRVPEPLEPLDTMALDGFLCGVVLQPQPIATERWLGFVADLEGRPVPAGYPLAELHALVLRRHAELAGAIAGRTWFDPWVYEIDEGDTPSASVLPWVAGFAAAMDLFPALMAMDDPELVEPLALLYRHFEAADLEDADALLAVIDTLEPPADLAEAVEDLVKSLMLLADVTQPRPRPATGRPRLPAGARSPRNSSTARTPRKR